MGINIWHHTKRSSRFLFRKTGHLFFPWMTHYFTNRYQTRHHHVVVDTILSMGMIVLVACNIGLFYWFYLFAAPANLDISISVPDYIISGAEIIYTVNYQNSDKKITDINIKLNAPESFSSAEANNLHINSLNKNQSGSWQIKGELLGNINETQRVIVTANYKFHGRSYQKFAAIDYPIKDSNFFVSINLPETILNNEEFDWSVHYKNNSPLERKNVVLTLDLPATLEITQAPENYDAENKQIILSEVLPWGEGDLAFKGRFSKAIGESNTIIGVKSSLNYLEKSYIQNIASSSINVLTPRLSIIGTAPALANIGSTFTYQVAVNNIGDADLNNVRVTTSINASGTLYYSAKYGSVSNNQASWIINNLPAHSKQIVYLFVSAPSSLRKENLAVSFSSKATAEIQDLTLSTYSSTVGSSIKYNSTLNFATDAKYYGPDNEQIGYGPYPLQAGEITAMRVFWNLNDFTNDLNNVTISTILPSQVEWTGMSAVSQGANITYDPATRKVTWHTSYIPAFAGPQGASFEVRISPNSQQIGKAINITNETYFSARDSFTQSVITRNLGAIRTPNIQ